MAARAAAAGLRPLLAGVCQSREFKDVVFEDVVFDDSSCVTLLYIVMYCNIYAISIVIKHHILKHILELPTVVSRSRRQA